MTAAIPALDDDPCARAVALKAKRDEIITGSGVAEFDSEQGNGMRRRVRYSSADLGRLDQEIATADRMCRLKSGKRPQRFAVSPKGRGW